MSRERDYGCAFFAAFLLGKPAENSQPFERYFGSIPMGSGPKSTNELPTGGSGRPRRCRLQRLLGHDFFDDPDAIGLSPDPFAYFSPLLTILFST